MPKHTPRIAIIGAGPAGIAAGHELLKQGFSDFTLFDSLDAPGGTWRLHSYPGLACDVWAHSYSFSYAPNPHWTASFVGQPEIQAYLERCRWCAMTWEKSTKPTRISGTPTPIIMKNRCPVVASEPGPL